PPIKLNPFTIVAISTPGICRTFSLNSEVTATVLSKDAPAGKETFTITIPLSSLGTNPVGVVDDAQKIAPIAAISITPVIHLCLYENPNDLTYFEVVASKPLLKPEKNLFKNPFFSFFSWCGLRKRADKAGLKVNALTAEIAMATISVTPNCS